jgi:hypothetical protein
MLPTNCVSIVKSFWPTYTTLIRIEVLGSEGSFRHSCIVPIDWSQLELVRYSMSPRSRSRGLSHSTCTIDRSVPLSTTGVVVCSSTGIAYNNPFLASSTFFANSPSFHPPLDPQMAIPSPNSTLSSLASQAQGQW